MSSHDDKKRAKEAKRQSIKRDAGEKRRKATAWLDEEDIEALGDRWNMSLDGYDDLDIGRLLIDDYNLLLSNWGRPDGVE